jgi:hypothetical protein
MKTPRAKYEYDPKYHKLVDTLVNAIIATEFTPSEIREAAILACIIYEEQYVRRYVKYIPEDVDKSFKVLEKWMNKNNNKRE